MPDGNKNIPTSSRQQREQRQDILTTTVRGIVQQEKAARDAKTAKLKALRLARDADAPPAVETPKKQTKKKVAADTGS